MRTSPKFFHFILFFFCLLSSQPLWADRLSLEGFEQVMREGIQRDFYFDEADDIVWELNPIIDSVMEELLEPSQQEGFDSAILVASMYSLLHHTFPEVVELEQLVYDTGSLSFQRLPRALEMIDVDLHDFLFLSLAHIFRSFDPWSGLYQRSDFESARRYQGEHLEIRRVPINDDVVYIKIAQFESGLIQNLSRRLRSFQNTRRPRGIILDLRDNPGGLLVNGALSVASLFIPPQPFSNQEPLLRYVGREEMENDRRQELSEPLELDFSDVPLMVLVNERTASSAEALAGILQAYGKAVILGHLTYGKGSFQEAIDFSEDGFDLILNVTRGYIYLPTGRCYDEIGITPDIEDTETPVNREARVRRPRFMQYFCEDEESFTPAFFNERNQNDLSEVIEALRQVERPGRTNHRWLMREENRLVHYATEMLEAWQVLERD